MPGFLSSIRRTLLVPATWCCLLASPLNADESQPDINNIFAKSIRQVFQQRCVQCHGEDGAAEGDVDLVSLKQVSELTQRPELIGDLIEVIDSGYMPPEDEPQLDEQTRSKLVSELRDLLHVAIASREKQSRTPIRRMNRFQYNNAVQDLLQLKVEVFALPERMMREHGGYFQPQTGRMPEKVRVGSRPLGKSQMIERRLAGVAAFPQDLRAEHGFDNRGDHLTLSPLLLESFLRLGHSIVESSDFSAKTCGIWNDFFAEPPAGGDQTTVIRQRLSRFLTRAFRRPADDDTVGRYLTYVTSRLDAGHSFVDAMKSAAAAALASPRFFYLYDLATVEDSKPLDDFNLASRLSFFLWGSIPDDELIELAAEGRLHQPEVLSQQVDRMLRDRRLKRFCDSFPAQWLQLERIVSSTPDRDRYPQFYFSKYRASMHMMLEPLLLFETVLVENRSILQFVDSDFSYRSNLLNAWYRDGKQGNAGPPTVVQFQRVPVTDRRQGGVITSAAVLTMTSGTTRTKPITRGAWLASVILNDPPPPPPGDVPPLADKPGEGEENLTLRERFATHRKEPACAGCHQRIDPLGFALENFDVAGVWRDTYENGRPVDASGILLGRHEFQNVVDFKDALLAEKDRFARAFAAHLLAFATGRETGIEDALVLDDIVSRAGVEEYRIHSLIRAVVQSESFRK
ncbi:MAG: DUF1592 domain-containing protein [Planctomycetota bacterium]|jgi:hypothetical protein